MKLPILRMKLWPKPKKWTAEKRPTGARETRKDNQPEYRAGRLRLAGNDFCQMGDAMPEEHRSFIEGERLRVARSQPGCGHLRAIAIARTDAPNRKPNWEVLGFDPELSPSMRSQAIEAIEIVRGQYVLTPYVKPGCGKASYEAMRVELEAAPVRGDES
jgi:hypothetical protein